MLKIVADNKIPFLEGALEGVAHVVYLPGAKITRSDLLHADALITRTRTRCDEQMLKGTPVKIIASATIGYDHIDTAWCEANGIYWTNAPGCNAASVKQYVASALAFIQEKEKFSFNDLTLGIIGAGNVGSKIKHLADALGINVLVNDPPRQRLEGEKGFSDMETLIANSDILTLHVPLNLSGADKTWHMVDHEFLSRMKQGAWLINSSRGEVVGTHALKESLGKGKLSGAVIDVWENEPEIDTHLLQQVAIGTPHIAGYSADGKANGTAMSVQAISKFFGLGLDHWYPEKIPAAAKNSLDIVCRAKSKEDIFREVSLFSYNIMDDSYKLKLSPETFEEQRGSYPIRREPHALRLKISQSSCNELFSELGYDVLV